MSQRSVLITGVSSGIGHSLAREYLERGYAVHGLSRRTPDDLVGRDGMAFRAIDLADLEGIAEPLRELIPAGASIDLVVLNAGVLGTFRDLADTPIADLKRMMDVNVWSCKVVLDTLLARAQVGQVVAVSSGVSVRAGRGWGGYALSKATLNMLMQLYAAERPDVHFTALAPGLVDTAMQRVIRSVPDELPFRSLDRLKAAHGTDAMPDPDTAARRLIGVFPGLRSRPSGGYLDVRTM